VTVPPLRLAHRGDWRHAPENTIEAFVAAMAVPGCDGVELDVRLAADGTPVVIHDETLARVQGRPDRVDALRGSDLAESGVPTLAAVLAALPEPAFVDVELKVDGGPGVVEVLAGARGSDLRRAVVSSFDPGAIERVRRRAPGWPTWLLSEHLGGPTLRMANDLGCVAVAAGWRAIDRASVAAARARGLDVAAWTVRRAATARQLEALGVVAMCVEGGALDERAETEVEA
jgi:glycerophosphoryl diester phosphodiesterase